MEPHKGEYLRAYRNGDNLNNIIEPILKEINGPVADSFKAELTNLLNDNILKGLGGKYNLLKLDNVEYIDNRGFGALLNFYNNSFDNFGMPKFTCSSEVKELFKITYCFAVFKQVEHSGQYLDIYQKDQENIVEIMVGRFDKENAPKIRNELRKFKDTIHKFDLVNVTYSDIGCIKLLSEYNKKNPIEVINCSEGDGNMLKAANKDNLTAYNISKRK